MQNPLANDQLLSELTKNFKSWAEISGKEMDPYLSEAVRMFKIYNNEPDTLEQNEEEDDEPRIFLPYAFGIVENINSKAVEPIFKLKPPCKVAPKAAGEDELAENFTAYAREFYNRVDFQLDYSLSEREKIIAGWAWEKDEWAMQYILGKKWEKQTVTELVQKAVRVIKKIVRAVIPVSYVKPVEVEHLYPERVGFHCKYPSIFDVFPEPRVRYVKDMHWLIELERNVALQDLEGQFYSDPQTGAKTPVFYLDEIKELLNSSLGSYSDQGSIASIFGGTDYGDDLMKHLYKRPEDYKGLNDIKRVHLAHVWEKKRYSCFALIGGNCYLIGYKEFPFHRPRIPYRRKVYTQSNLSVNGKSALKPVEHVLYMLNDIQEYGMKAFFRLVNDMVAIKEEGIVSLDDFDRRSGGKVRIKGDRPISDYIMNMPGRDQTSTMFAQQSNIRGFAEWATAVSDLSPGTEGTKQNHDTLGGLMEIQSNMASRHSMTARQALANFQDQMEFMSQLVEQHQFDPITLKVYLPNGKTEIRQFTRDDLVSPAGFDFVIEVDPDMGNDAVKRNHLMILFDLGLKYEAARMQSGNPSWEVLNVPEIFRKLLNTFGWQDTSEMFKAADGVLQPQQEHELMLQGAQVPPNPRENLIQHYSEHYLFNRSPEMMQMRQSGKVTPEQYTALIAHEQATLALIQQALQNPAQMAQLPMIQNAQTKAAVGATA